MWGAWSIHGMIARNFSRSEAGRVAIKLHTHVVSSLTYGPSRYPNERGRIVIITPKRTTFSRFDHVGFDRWAFIGSGCVSSTLAEIPLSPRRSSSGVLPMRTAMATSKCRQHLLVQIQNGLLDIASLSECHDYGSLSRANEAWAEAMTCCVRPGIFASICTKLSWRMEPMHAQESSLQHSTSRTATRTTTRTTTKPRRKLRQSDTDKKKNKQQEHSQKEQQQPRNRHAKNMQQPHNHLPQEQLQQEQYQERTITRTRSSKTGRSSLRPCNRWPHWAGCVSQAHFEVAPGKHCSAGAEVEKRSAETNLIRACSQRYPTTRHKGRASLAAAAEN